MTTTPKRTLCFYVTVPIRKDGAVTLATMRWRVLWALLTRRDIDIKVGAGGLRP